MNPQILIVDDDRGMCEFLEVGLATRNLTVRWTTDPRKVPELLRETPFEVVVTDLNMPNQNGIALTQQLLGSGPSSASS